MGKLSKFVLVGVLGFVAGFMAMVPLCRARVRDIAGSVSTTVQSASTVVMEKACREAYTAGFDAGVAKTLEEVEVKFKQAIQDAYESGGRDMGPVVQKAAQEAALPVVERVARESYAAGFRDGVNSR